MRVGIVGAGWAGLACAVEAVSLGHEVQLFEMAAQPGGRARSIDAGGLALDNGQHILIGAYRDTLASMRRVGVDVDAAFLRLPLALLKPDGRGLRLPGGAPVPAFVRGVIAHRGWRWAERLALLGAAARWRLRGFRCDPDTDVASFTARLPEAVRRDVIEPLAVAALNTPAHEASAAVLLRVLHDALFAGPGSSDLLLPRVALSELLPEPARRWLQARGAQLRSGARVGAIERAGGGWRVDGEPVDAVVLACGPLESARLAEPHAAPWAALVRALRFQPIATVYLEAEPAGVWPCPMLALESDTTQPAQFAFDLGALHGAAARGRIALVASGVADWLDRGTPALESAALAQAARQLGGLCRGAPRVLRTIVEKRATFACTPGLRRPPQRVAPGLLAAGDIAEGPYPATLEGAVRSGIAAARALP